MKCFEEFITEDHIILNYNFTEIKQFTHISFPCVLLFKKSEEQLEIEYEIISKESSELKVGILSPESNI